MKATARRCQAPLEPLPGLDRPRKASIHRRRLGVHELGLFDGWSAGLLLEGRARRALARLQQDAPPAPGRLQTRLDHADVGAPLLPGGLRHAALEDAIGEVLELGAELVALAVRRLGGPPVD